MVEFPAAKINLGLYVTDKRADGYHNIETLFYPIGFSDILEVVPVGGGADGIIDLSLTGIPVDGNPDTNLVVRAYRILNERAKLPGVRAFVHKCIPTGAGLGGGSSDGAAMLKVLDRLFGLGIPNVELSQMALELGSDCPFLLECEPSFAKGRGEIISNANISLNGCYLQLFHPGTGISTAAAYRHVPIGRSEVSLEEMVGLPKDRWKGLIQNVFEPYAFEQQPIIQQIKEELYRSGAIYASMTGSGSAVYGLFDRETEVPPALSAWFIWKERL